MFDMPLHLHFLFRTQGICLEEQFSIDKEFADLRQVGGRFDSGNLHVTGIHRLGNFNTEPSHQPGMTGEVRIRQLNRTDQGFNRFRRRLFMMLLDFNDLRDVADDRDESGNFAGRVFQGRF